MLKVSDGSIIAKAISLGQRMAGQLNPSVVHAGVMFDSTYIIEAQGSGVSANDLRVGNLNYGYLVYRATQGNIANGAGTFAKILFDVHKRGGNLKYSVPGAVGSLLGGKGRADSASEMDRRLDAILAGKSHPYFCSQLVVMVYQFAAEQNGVAGKTLFPFADPKVSPSTLSSHVAGSQHFKEAGYVLPKER
jgi:hypothetical protein